MHSAGSIVCLPRRKVCLDGHSAIRSRCDSLSIPRRAVCTFKDTNICIQGTSLALSICRGRSGPRYPTCRLLHAHYTTTYPPPNPSLTNQSCDIGSVVAPCAEMVVPRCPSIITSTPLPDSQTSGLENQTLLTN